MDTDSPIFNETFCRMPTSQLFTTLGPSRTTSQVGSRRIRRALLSGYILLLQNLFWTTQWWKAWPHYEYFLNIFCSFKIYVGTYLYLLFPILYFQNTSTQTLHIGPLKFRRSVNRNIPQSCMSWGRKFKMDPKTSRTGCESYRQMIRPLGNLGWTSDHFEGVSHGWAHRRFQLWPRVQPKHLGKVRIKSGSPSKLTGCSLPSKSSTMALNPLAAVKSALLMCSHWITTGMCRSSCLLPALLTWSKL